MTKVYKPGTKAITNIGEIAGIITAVSVRFDSVNYEFSYFNAGDYKSCYLNESEFTVIEDTKIKIGFHANSL